MQSTRIATRHDDARSTPPPLHRLRRRRLLPAVACLLAAFVAGCPSGEECTRNSECAVGSYCSRGACTSDCTAATVATDCSPGESCSPFGMCVGTDAGPRDAGVLDAPATVDAPLGTDVGSGTDASTDGGGGIDASELPDVGPPDAGTDAPDLRPACVIAGGTDADGDGFCAGALTGDDCNDAATDVRPDAAEVCTDSEGTLAPADENCDGSVDEACTISVGVPHSLLDIVTARQSQWHPRLSVDGLRLYTGAYDPATSRTIPHVATRTSVSARFGRAVPLPGTWTVGSGIYVASPTEDELEVFLQVAGAGGGDQIQVATRTSTSMPFGAPTAVISGGGNWRHPAISADGLTLYYEGGGGAAIYRVTRASRTAAFGTPSIVLMSSVVAGVTQIHSPWVLANGGLLFMAANATTTRVFRVDPSGAGFGAPVEIPGLAGEGWPLHQGITYSVATRELFFAATRAWSVTGSASNYAIWRAEACLDGACPLRQVDCATGTRSLDGLHCYTATPSATTYAAAETACVAGGGYVVEVHSAAEQALLWTTFGGTTNLWMGFEQTATPNVFAWSSGAVATYTNWHPTEPNADASEACTMLTQDLSYAGRWADVNCGTSIRAICENERWPTW